VNALGVGIRLLSGPAVQTELPSLEEALRFESLNA
jgi:hypothetical protein